MIATNCQLDNIVAIKMLFDIVDRKYFMRCASRQPTMDDQQQRDHHANQRNPNSDASKAERDHHSNQSNPNSSAHKAAADNKSDQKNPNNRAYDASRGDGEKK